jgi:hypothetical protein
MTKPVTEAELVELAQKFVKSRGDFGPESSRHSWRFFKKVELCGKISFREDDSRIIPKIDLPMEWNEKSAANLITAAQRGDADADIVLREIAAELLERSADLPDQLRQYAATCLRNYRRSKRSAHKTHSRNMTVAGIVYSMIRHTGLNPTRNRETAA